jgi:hypothetical protein
MEVGEDMSGPYGISLADVNDSRQRVRPFGRWDRRNGVDAVNTFGVSASRSRCFASLDAPLYAGQRD